MKKTADQWRPGKRYGLALMNFSKDQLAGIGAVAVTYNVAEELIDDLVRIGWRLQFDPKEILTRIGGVDGKIALAKMAAEMLKMPQEMRDALGDALGEGGFTGLKKYRDGVVHARAWDAASAIGIVVERRNRRAEVLLSVDALSGLSARLEALWLELRALKEGYLALRDLAVFQGDQQKAQLEAEYRAAMARYRSCRTQRRSLPPLPELPAAPPMTEPAESLKDDQSGQPEPSA